MKTEGSYHYEKPYICIFKYVRVRKTVGDNEPEPMVCRLGTRRQGIGFGDKGDGKKSDDAHSVLGISKNNIRDSVITAIFGLSANGTGWKRKGTGSPGI